MAPLERAARALCEAQGYAPNENEMARAVEEVRAVLQAIREPSPKMCKAGVYVADTGAAIPAFEAMIDAALSE